MKIGGLIVAAGLSSRMQDFKPLMKIENKPLIINTINSLRQSGIEDITIVVGYRGKDIEQCVKDENVNIIYNENYNNSFMYDSFKIGLREVASNCDAIAFIPGDIGFVSKYTVDLLIKELESTESKIVQPKYKNEVGHPPIISSQCFDYLLTYEGEGGLKGGMNHFEEESLYISTPDKFILFDMDTKEDFIRVKRDYESRQNLSYEDCKYLLKYFNVSENIISHSEKVKNICTDLGQSINKYKNTLNIELLKSAAMLHDIKRHEKNHSKEGANLLKDLGYEKIASIVETHMKIDNEMENNINENTILYYCDKLAIEDKFVDIDKRFKDKLNKYKYSKEIQENIMKKYNTTLKIKSNIISIIGKDEYEKLENKWRGENDLFK